MPTVLWFLQKMRIKDGGRQESDVLGQQLIHLLKHRSSSQGEQNLTLRDEIELSEKNVDEYHVVDRISLEDMRNLFQILQSVPEICYLSFSRSVINIHMMQGIAEGIVENTTLESLDFSKAKIDSTHAGIIIDALESNQTLKRINFSGNQMGDKAIVKVAQLLKFKPNIQSLNLSFMALSQDAIKAVIDALVENTTLEFLNISDNNIDSVYIYRIALALFYNKKLKVLNITGSFFDSENLIELVRSFTMRNCSIKLVVGGAYVTTEVLNALSDFISGVNLQFRKAGLLEFVDIDPECVETLNALQTVINEHTLDSSVIKSKKAIQFSQPQSPLSLSTSTSTSITTKADTVSTTSPRALVCTQVSMKPA